MTFEPGPTPKPDEPARACGHALFQLSEAEICVVRDQSALARETYVLRRWKIRECLRYQARMHGMLFFRLQTIAAAAAERVAGRQGA